MLPFSALALDPRAHAHEMLLGFALAVVAGNQLGALLVLLMRVKPAARGPAASR